MKRWRLFASNPTATFLLTIATLLLGKKRRDKIWPRIIDPFAHHKFLGILPDGNFILSRQSTKDQGIINEIYGYCFYNHFFKPKRAHVVVDVGAHIGIYALKAAKLVGNEGIVLAFEPETQNFSLLLKNIALNRAKNVIPLKIALANFIGRAKLYIDPNNVGGHSLVYHDRENWREVNVSTLDAIISKLAIEFVDLMKIDVEGGELDVLKGARGLLQRKAIKKVVVAAYHCSTEAKEIEQYLLKNDFHVRVLRHQTRSREWPHVYGWQF